MTPIGSLRILLEHSLVSYDTLLHTVKINDKKDALPNQVASTQLNIDNHFSNSPLLRL